MRPASSSSENTEGQNSFFKVVMKDYDDVVFQSCEGLQSELEVVFLPEGGRGGAPRAVRGLPRSNKIVFSKGDVLAKSSKKSLFDWYLETCDFSKPLKRQTLTIQLLDAQKEAVRTWQVVDAW
ncbi:phage tail protein, partial [bacterium]|nr:phage tail protein [bacterium]